VAARQRSAQLHRRTPDTVIVLPRDSDRSYAVGSGLDGGIDWVFSSGVLQPPGGPSAFESHVGRKHVRHESQTSADVASARDALLALGTHALVDQFHDDHCVVYFPSIKGRLVLMQLGDEGVDALIVHDDGVAPSSLTVIQTALERAGFPFSYSWGDNQPPGSGSQRPIHRS
jgi:hypothetical protein